MAAAVHTNNKINLPSLSKAHKKKKKITLTSISAPPNKTNSKSKFNITQKMTQFLYKTSEKLTSMKSKLDDAATSILSNKLKYQKRHQITGVAEDRFDADNDDAQIVKAYPYRAWKYDRAMKGKHCNVQSVVFDPAGKWLGTGSVNGSVKFWDVKSGELKRTILHTEGIRLAAAPNHPGTIFTGGRTNQIKWYDVEHGAVVSSYVGDHFNGVSCLTVSDPHYNLIIAGLSDSSCRVWDIRTTNEGLCLSGHKMPPLSIMARANFGSNYEHFLISGSKDSTLKLWDLRSTGKCMSSITLLSKKSLSINPVTAIAMDPYDKNDVVSVAFYDYILRVKLPEGNLVDKMSLVPSPDEDISPLGSVRGLIINQHNVMVAGSDRGQLWFWDTKTGRNVQQLSTFIQKGSGNFFSTFIQKGPGNFFSEPFISTLAFDATGTRLVTCEADKSIKMWRQRKR